MTYGNHPIVCLNCFLRSKSIVHPCVACGSRRCAHVAFLVQQLGEHWKELMEAERGPVQ